MHNSTLYCAIGPVQKLCTVHAPYEQHPHTEDMALDTSCTMSLWNNGHNFGGIGQSGEYALACMLSACPVALNLCAVIAQKMPAVRHNIIFYKITLWLWQKSRTLGCAQHGKLR